MLSDARRSTIDDGRSTMDDRRWTIVPALLTAFLLVAAAPASSEIIDRILAAVSGQIITQSDVEAALALGLVEARHAEAPAGSNRLAGGLQSLIDRVLMLNEVSRVVPPEPAVAAVDARLADIRRRFESPAALERVLSASGIDESVLRLYAADDLRLESYLDERFSAASQPTEDEVRQAGEADRERLMTERRQTLISAWIAELRRRADLTILAPA
jgi:hypothetical protein